MRRESRPPAIVAAALGGGGLALIVLGSVALAADHGLVPVRNVVEGITSPALRTVLIVGVALGVGGIVLGWGTYRRMPTKLSREEAVGGAVLGLQAVLLGSVFLWFSRGDVETFARNFLNFGDVTQEIGAFATGAKNTLLLALAGEGLGIVLGLVLSVFAISKRPVVRAPARAYINFFRGTPLIWQLSFIGLGLPLGLHLRISTYAAAVVAFTLNTGAYTAEVFRAGIQSIERGQLEAARGLGMSYLQSMRYAIVPQAIRRVIPPLMNEFVILIKDTSLVLVLGLTAAQRELMSVGSQGYSNSANATFFVATAIGYLAVTLPLIRLVNAIEKRLRSGLVGITA